MIVTIDEKFRDGKLQYNINGEAAKILALLSCKIGKYEYCAGEKIVPFNQSQIIEQAKFTYSPLVKQRKTTQDQGKKQTKVLDYLNFSNKLNELKQVEDIFPDNQFTSLIKDKEFKKLYKFRTLLK